MERYINYDWTRSVVDMNSTYGCFLTLGLTMISWYNRKQQLVKLSSIEVEYMVVSMSSYGVV